MIITYNKVVIFIELVLLIVFIIYGYKCYIIKSLFNIVLSIIGCIVCLEMIYLDLK